MSGITQFNIIREAKMFGKHKVGSIKKVRGKLAGTQGNT
jgi:hypothetical protein